MSKPGLRDILRRVAAGLEPKPEEKIEIYWPDDPDVPRGPNVIELQWGDDEEQENYLR